MHNQYLQKHNMTRISLLIFVIYLYCDGNPVKNEFNLGFLSDVKGGNRTIVGYMYDYIVYGIMNNMNLSSTQMSQSNTPHTAHRTHHPP